MGRKRKTKKPDPGKALLDEDGRREWGSIFLRPRPGGGTYGYYVRYRDHRGKATMVPGGETEEDALAVLEQKREEVRARLAGELRPMLLAEFLPEYWPVLRSALAKTSYETSSAHLVEAAEWFGEQTVDGIRKSDVEDWIAELVDEDLAPQTVRNKFYSLRRCFRFAIERRVARTNPCDGVDLPQVHEYQVPWLSPEDVRRLLAHVALEVRAELTLLAETGLRLGELLRLAWGDLAGDRSALTVGKSKTRRTRVVPLTARAREALEEIEARKQAKPLHGPDRIVRWTAFQVRLRFRKAVKAGEFTHLRLHDLRHAYASHLVRAGVPIPTVAALLGHSTPHLVLTRYGHHAPKDASYQATEQLEAFRRPPAKGRARPASPRAASG